MTEKYPLDLVIHKSLVILIIFNNRYYGSILLARIKRIAQEPDNQYLREFCYKRLAYIKVTAGRNISGKIWISYGWKDS